MTNEKEKSPNFEFIGKYIITADIELKTALHIGGTEEGFDIGGIDNPVIKDKVSGLPYIPGSSLKGKLRSLLEWAYGEVVIKQKDGTKEWRGLLCSKPDHPIGIVFGIPAEDHNQKDAEKIPGPARLTVRDAYPVDNQKEIWEKAMGENIYTEAKTENSIDRLTSAATPRSMERVPAGSKFKAEFVYDVYKKEDIPNLKLLFQGMLLLEDSYLGGGGTRGSGKVEFSNITIIPRDISYYVGGVREALPAKQNGNKKARDLFENFENIFQVK
ncbi:MAG: type III-A CRISPR-associated RAMP protein Csm3 [Deltaproteobacteria bacterium]|nr:type III-A CRISPR-associated RAMP protein Csm3 [Deltaproteobacteria bacterium]